MYAAQERHDRRPVVTVLGAGTMGTAIAHRLLGVGMSVSVWNRSPQPALALAELGATAFDDPREAVAMADVVLTLLPTQEAVAGLMLGCHVVEAMMPNAAWAQLGTIGVQATEALDSEVRTRRPDIRFVDAPVSGSRAPAEAGSLLVLASGPDSAREVLVPVFDAVGRRTLWLGPAGTGSRLKLVLNTWLAFEVEAAAEGAALASHFGISPGVLAEALDGNPLASDLAFAKLSKIETNDHRSDFALAWALKDLELMRASVGERNAPIALAIAERWRTLVDRGFGDLDVSAARLGLGEEGADRGDDRGSTVAADGNEAPDARLEAERAGRP